MVNSEPPHKNHAQRPKTVEQVLAGVSPSIREKFENRDPAPAPTPTTARSIGDISRSVVPSTPSTEPLKAIRRTFALVPSPVRAKAMIPRTTPKATSSTPAVSDPAPDAPSAPGIALGKSQHTHHVPRPNHDSSPAMFLPPSQGCVDDPVVRNIVAVKYLENVLQKHYGNDLRSRSNANGAALGGLDRGLEIAAGGLDIGRGAHRGQVGVVGQPFGPPFDLEIKPWLNFEEWWKNNPKNEG